MNELQPEDILSFWFGDDATEPLARQETWFKKNPDFDAEVTARFEGHLSRAPGGHFAEWWREPESALAFILLTDQFSRNIHRDTPESFRFDPLALHCSLLGQGLGLYEELPPIQRYFFIMPLMHTEHRAMQQRSVETFAKLAAEGKGESEKVRTTLERALGYAQKHRDVIERFGRFPHRNPILGRANTPEEDEYLSQPGSGF